MMHMLTHNAVLFKVPTVLHHPHKSSWQHDGCVRWCIHLLALVQARHDRRVNVACVLYRVVSIQHALLCHCSSLQASSRVVNVHRVKFTVCWLDNTFNIITDSMQLCACPLRPALLCL
jgi:hypothetical protein